MLISNYGVNLAHYKLLRIRLSGMPVNYFLNVSYWKKIFNFGRNTKNGSLKVGVSVSCIFSGLPLKPWMHAQITEYVFWDDTAIKSFFNVLIIVSLVFEKKAENINEKSSSRRQSHLMNRTYGTRIPCHGRNDVVDRFRCLK